MHIVVHHRFCFTPAGNDYICLAEWPEKNNIEQTDMIEQNYMDKYKCKDIEVKTSMRQDKKK